MGRGGRWERGGKKGMEGKGGKEGKGGEGGRRPAGLAGVGYGFALAVAGRTRAANGLTVLKPNLTLTPRPSFSG
jgi:hypothetical protein